MNGQLGRLDKLERLYFLGVYTFFQLFDHFKPSHFKTSSLLSARKFNSVRIFCI